MKRFVVLTLIFLGASLAQEKAVQDKPGPGKAADLIFVNGDFYLGATNSGDKVIRTESRPAGCATDKNCAPRRRDEALAVKGGRILATGSTAEIRRQYQGTATQVIDLGGHFAIPGFNDAHAHLANAGFEKLNVNLIGAKSLAEMQSRIAERVKSAAPGEWILGRGWDHTMWPGRTLPSRQDLDKVTGDHPAILGRVDGHIAVANTAALRAAGITKDTQAKPGSAIDHDASGEPTGILREDAAMQMVRSKVPPLSPQLRRRGLELALHEAAVSGVTSVQDNSDWADFQVMEQLEREGKLTARIYEWLPFNETVENLKKMRAAHPADDLMLHTGMLKGFMDGSLGSRTAALLAPYSDDPKNSGLSRYTQDRLNEMVAERTAAGFQIGFHAIGDRGVEMALRAFRAGLAPGCERPGVAEQFCTVEPNRRFRIEHSQVVQPKQVAQYVALGVIASVQPNHLLTDMNWAEERLGKDRASNAYRWKSFLDAGVPIAFGTDYPVEPIQPYRGIYSAVTRKSEAGDKEYFPAERLTIDQAIAAYTTGPAYAEFEEKIKGTLAPGMLADFVVLDRDLSKATPAEILKTKVLRTVVGGKTVYQAQ